MQQGLAAAEREAMAREAQLGAACEEAASLGRAHHEAQVEIQQYIMDLQVCPQGLQPGTDHSALPYALGVPLSQNHL